MIVLAILMALLELLALCVLLRQTKTGEASGASRNLRRLSWILGAVMGIGAVAILWPGLDGFWYWGFPLPGVGFRIVGDVWTDYVSDVVVPLLVADFVLMSFLPRAIVAVWETVGVGSGRRRPGIPGDSDQ